MRNDRAIGLTPVSRAAVAGSLGEDEGAGKAVTRGRRSLASIRSVARDVRFYALAIPLALFLAWVWRDELENEVDD